MSRVRPLLLAVLLVASVVPAAADELAPASPEEEQLAPDRLARVTAMITAAVDRERLPGVVAVIGRGGRIAYFKAVSSEVGIPYQSLINLYLRDCVAARRRPRLDWRPSGPAT